MRNRTFSLQVLLAVAFAVLLPVLLQTVDALGHRIPQKDIASDFIKGFLTAAALMIAVISAPIRGIDKRNLVILWAAKTLVTLVVMLFYENQYGLDAYEYFRHSQARYPDFSRIGIGNGTENLTAMLWTFENHIFRTSSFHTLKVLCSFIGMTGIYFFYRGLSSVSDRVKPSLLLYIGLFPSILFWSSILGKDPIILFGICVSSYAVFRLFGTKNLIYVIPLAVGLLCTAAIRTWMVPIILLPFVVGAIMRFQNIVIRMVLIGALVTGGLYGLRHSSQSIAVDNAEALSSEVNKMSRSWNRGGSATNIPELSSPAAMAAYLPIGMFTALFRPLPGDVLNVFGLLASLENVFLLYLVWRAILNRRHVNWQDPMLIWFLGFVLIWSMLYAFISPQNLGSAARFKLQVMPAMLVLLFHLATVKRRNSSSDQAADSKDSTHPYDDLPSY